MESLKTVNLTPEQRKLAVNTKPMNRIIRGAAGSGKTTSALFLLKIGLLHHKTMKMRTGDHSPIKAVVFTFNKTLKAYIESLSKEIAGQVTGIDIQIEVVHLAKWMMERYPYREGQKLRITPHTVCIPKPLLSKSPLSYSDTLDEIEYVLGRYKATEFSSYVENEVASRVDTYTTNKEIRTAIIEHAVKPYIDYKATNNIVDLNDMTHYFSENMVASYEVLIADECQDFSTNDLRAIVNQLSPDSFGTFVLDTAQKIYRRSFTWKEIGLTIRPENSFRLTQNYRNTKEIADFASCLLRNVNLDHDATLPNNSNCDAGGSKPIIIEGKFSEQLSYVINHIKNHVDLKHETVAFLHRKGYGCFKFLRGELKANNLPFCEITSQVDWPAGDENIALSTLHSVKGLEFDHVFIIGMDKKHFPFEEVNDHSYQEACRLIAMGITRAKKSVILGYKKNDKPFLIDFFCDSTFERQ
ncbi:3'-5' exonuclease [Photobacterium leiognathi]|uniref:3'-5' exonuclease n=1 Tax=Photobacterium leiognathi TaxID=553611 RepID=UPI0029819E28|nr:3'-5' exonuclease [Photobacterium leiognathi]